MAFFKTNFRYWSSRVKKRRSGQWVSPDCHVSVSWRGVGLKWINLHTANKGYAAKQATILWEALVSHGWERAQRVLSAPAADAKGGLTIGRFLDCLEVGSSISPITFKSQKLQNHHGGMVLLDGRLYLREQDKLMCYDLKKS